jgi:thymidylate synthase (FAD)
MKVKIKSITPEIEKTIVEIARVSSKRKDKSEKPEGLINYLIKNNHWSPFEHGYITFEIETSKAIAIQLLRHVSFRFQEFSQRYAVVQGIEDIEFRKQAEDNRQSSTEEIGAIKFEGSVVDEYFATPQQKEWMQKVSKNLLENKDLYDEGLKLGIARECARMILPMATSTTLFMTGSVRSWIHMFDVRDDPHAQKEIQIIAKELKHLFIKQCPIISKARDFKQKS